MPTVVSNQDTYHVSDHRRQSSRSQINLADLNRNSPSQIQSPNRSLVFLPSTTYTQPQPATQRSRTPSSPSASNLNVTSDPARGEDPSVDPHEFYRQYQEPFSGASPAALHQAAFRTTTYDTGEGRAANGRKSSFASSQANDGTSTRPGRSSVTSRKLSLNTQHLANGTWNSDHTKSSPAAPNPSRSRKASFKDLVARFDASPEEVPPLPIQQIPRPVSRTASPLPYASKGAADLHSSGLPQPARPRPGMYDSRGTRNAAAAETRVLSNDNGQRGAGSSPGRLTQVVSNPEVQEGGRKLLFGEVVPTQSTLPAAGYGIFNPRRRRGSEGSPMHSPNPMFSSMRGPPIQEESKPSASLHWQPLGQSHAGLPSMPRDSGQKHRRANSDFAGAPSKALHHGGQTQYPESITGANQIPYLLEPSARSSGQSRIPVSTRHHRMASDSVANSPTDCLPLSSQLPLRLHESGQSLPNHSPSGDRKPASPRRRPRSPVKIKSPGKQGRGPRTATGEKSPSLRANIIAPPPKVSPPLRSSRPRLPVSAATTAASRAKMAEKFETMAKQQNEKKSLGRRRPPELTDIDLKARRLRITQALSRSREGQELENERHGLRSSSANQTNSTTASTEESDKINQKIMGRDEIPAVIVDEPIMDTSDERAFYTSGHELTQDQRAFTLNALKVVESSTPHPGEEMDSPTLGRPEASFSDIPFTLNTHLLPAQSDQDPYSAAGTEKTDATEATMTDMEPEHDETQLQTRGQSLLNQIRALRSQGSDSPISSTSQVSRLHSDHADEVSVRLMLRETTYLDDEEAVEKGYRPFVPPLDSGSMRPGSNGRSSWTSSIENHRESEIDETIAADGDPTVSLGRGEEIMEVESDCLSDGSGGEDDSDGGVESNDTYTIVNIVLQQQTPSGVVDQQLVDSIYHRIIQISPDLADAERVDEGKVKRLCLQELEEYSSHWEQAENSRPQSEQYLHSESLEGVQRDMPGGNSDNSNNLPEDSALHYAPFHPPPTQRNHRTHRYKPSLDSAEDWAETSPSVGDWLQFGLHSPLDARSQREPSSLARDAPETGTLAAKEALSDLGYEETNYVDLNRGTLAAEADIGIPRPPSHSPPPPPVTKMPSIDQISRSSLTGIKPSMSPAVPVPRPFTAMSQISARSSVEHQMMPSSSSATRPSVEEQTAEQRRLTKRRHVLKELVDTEYTYERDMRVLCDIYKQTAVVAISDEDSKILFGNVESVQQFSKDFLGLLKQVVRPAYVMERTDRRKETNRASTLQSSATSIDSVADMTDAEKDELTRVGQAFEASISDMEKVYTEYIRTRHAANKRLEALQSASAVKEWLKECSENSTDITNAWSLDALLVKPIQRITKYPLLLNQLLEATPNTHPDAIFLRRAAEDVTEINVRINEVKKHTELVDQVLNRKRKDSDVRNGFTKAFGRRAEKLRQHVGINEMYEDAEYTKLKICYDNNIAHLFLVARDCQGYLDAIKQWVVHMCDLAAAAEAWVDVGHTSHSQAESRLRQFAIVIRGITSIALPDHVDQVTRRILEPMGETTAMLAKFKNDTKGLVQKRDKRLLDYNQFKNKRDRGEKLDKKMTERMEQWEALNLEAKERMRRLLKSTGELAKSCLAILLELHLSWLEMCRQKFSALMDVPLDKLDRADIVKDWQEDFDYHEAAALTLSICNGSLLAEAVNMVSFLTPGSTLASEDSPRQPSWNSVTKRSVSANEEGPQLSMADQYYRNSGGPLSSQNDDPSERSSFTFVNSRIRATSATSGRIPKTPETGSRGPAASIHTVNSANVSRPGTSPGQIEETRHSTPRLSLEAPSPSIGPLVVESPMRVKHASTSTFYSAAPEPNQSQSSLHAMSGASTFSPAMPRGQDGEEGEESETAEAHPEPGVLFTAASVYEFNIDRSRQQGGFRYLTYVAGEIFDVIAEQGELWLAINQDDPTREIGWIWNKHFTKLTD
ncbi:hypothetical protein A1O3_08505 [Capronia epimyces CBS 606.96]|uniref:DH domain-containing protein n=1 Tax=Capronia epimyces CBS 606.96 TaxID=1182542 RepID=W9Y9E3_9EURO|nr:uncharacterized protein A1O3_08505 [Capronia epimyces CBS 606.96]EXJ79004.1 hypothetical protein A1O3_08505 [Capronia epimyces CBS 606.96]